MSAAQNVAPITLVERLCDELTRASRSPDEVARGLGTITDRQPSALYVKPTDPQLAQVIVTLLPDGKTLGNVYLDWTEPRLTLDELQRRFGEPRLPPRIHPGPQKRTFTIDDAARPLTCRIVATPSAIGARTVARIGVLPEPRS